MATQATKPTVKNFFAFDTSSGEVKKVNYEDVLEDILTQNEQSEVDAALEANSLLTSEKAGVFYSASKKSLQNYKDHLENQDEKAGNKEEIPADGKKLADAENDRVGEMFTDEKTNRPKVRFTHPTSGKEKSVYYKAGVWDEISEKEFLDRQPALVPEIVEEIELAVFDEKTKKRKEEIEQQIYTGQDKLKEGFVEVAQGMSIYRREKLYEDEYVEFKIAAKEKFGIHEKSLHRLARLGDFMNTVPLLTDGSQIDINQEVAKQMSDMVGRVQADLELSHLELNEIRPILDATFDVFKTVAPKDEGGKIIATGRTVKEFRSFLLDVVKQTPVTIDGEDISVEDATQQGILGVAKQAELLETIAESIRRSNITIQQDAKPKPSPDTAPPVKESKQYYRGGQPEVEMQCSAHKNGDKIVSIGKGALRMNCGCAGRVNENGEFYIYQVKGKEVRDADPALREEAAE